MTSPCVLLTIGIPPGRLCSQNRKVRHVIGQSGICVHGTLTVRNVIISRQITLVRVASGL